MPYRLAIPPRVTGSFSQISSRHAGGDREAAPGWSVPISAGLGSPTCYPSLFVLLSSSYARAFPFVMMGRYPNALTSTSVTGHAIDSKNNLIYMQVPDATQPTDRKSTRLNSSHL